MPRKKKILLSQLFNRAIVSFPFLLQVQVLVRWNAQKGLCSKNHLEPHVMEASLSHCCIIQNMSLVQLLQQGKEKLKGNTDIHHFLSQPFGQMLSSYHPNYLTTRGCGNVEQQNVYKAPIHCKIYSPRQRKVPLRIHLLIRFLISMMLWGKST